MNETLNRMLLVAKFNLTKSIIDLFYISGLHFNTYHEKPVLPCQISTFYQVLYLVYIVWLYSSVLVDNVSKLRIFFCKFMISGVTLISSLSLQILTSLVSPLSFCFP